MRGWKSITLGLTFVAALGTPAHATDSGIIVEKFSAQGIAYGRGGSCWEWSNTWHVYNGLGRLKYAPAEHLIWCPNDRRTVVKGLPSNGCWNAGGYWDYNGCSRWHSASGYSHMRVVDTW